MSYHSLQRAALLPAMAAFLTLCLLLSVFTLARTAHLIDPLAYQCALGQIVSLMLLASGNFLPKLRPLHGTRIARSEGARAERLAGRALVLAGVVSFTLFIRAPLAEAKVAAAWLGFGTLLMIGCHWSWIAYSARVQAALESSPATPERRLTRWLLITYGYICVSAWSLALIGNGPEHANLRTWLVTGFSLLVSVVLPALEVYPRTRCRVRLRLE